MKIKIKVTKNHIKNGLKESYNFCPIALAIRTAGFKLPDVSSTGISFREKNSLNQIYIEKPPRKAITFINRFDSGKPVKPITIQLITEYE